jgi:hypothetical protein
MYIKMTFRQVYNFSSHLQFATPDRVIYLWSRKKNTPCSRMGHLASLIEKKRVGEKSIEII